MKKILDAKKIGQGIVKMDGPRSFYVELDDGKYPVPEAYLSKSLILCGDYLSIYSNEYNECFFRCEEKKPRQIEQKEIQIVSTGKRQKGVFFDDEKREREIMDSSLTFHLRNGLQSGDECMVEFDPMHLTPGIIAEVIERQKGN
jgi:hypothetical protein